jgi:cell pole-organizing protein PopZ
MGDINREPSMEEILASIKRVIADDGRASGQPRGARRPQPVAEPEPEVPEDVLELSDPVSEENGLLSQGATAASRQALASLAALRQGEPAEPELQAPASDAPLEALVKEMLKPMLKDWLDQRLPDMVEELVTREIARITGKHL